MMYYVLTKPIPDRSWNYVCCACPQVGVYGYAVKEHGTPRNKLCISIAPSHLGYFGNRRVKCFISINLLKPIGKKSPKTRTTRQARKIAEKFNFANDRRSITKREASGFKV